MTKIISEANSMPKEAYFHAGFISRIRAMSKLLDSMRSACVSLARRHRDTMEGASQIQNWMAPGCWKIDFNV